MTSLLDLIHTGMRLKSTGSSSARIWMPSKPTCAQSCTTRRSSFAISSLSRISLLNSSPFTCHLHHHHHSEQSDHQGSLLHPFLLFYIDIENTVLTCLGGVGDRVTFVLFLCFFALVCLFPYLFICFLSRVSLLFISVSSVVSVFGLVLCFYFLGLF